MKYCFTAFTLSILLFACQQNQSNLPTAEEITAETQKFNAALDSIFDYEVSLSPVRQSYLGIKDRNAEWDVSNDSVSVFYNELAKNNLGRTRPSGTTYIQIVYKQQRRKYQKL
jgi:hypothetical protein